MLQITAPLKGGYSEVYNIKIGISGDTDGLRRYPNRPRSGAWELIPFPTVR